MLADRQCPDAFAGGCEDRVHQGRRKRRQARLPGAYVTLSSELLPQLGYYQRVSTTVLNSYVGPLLSSYLHAITAPLGLSQAIANIAHSLTYTTMKFNAQPQAAEQELCG